MRCWLPEVEWGYSIRESFCTFSVRSRPKNVKGLLRVGGLIDGFRNEIPQAVRKTLYDGFGDPVFMGYDTFAAKAVPRAIRFGAGAIRVDVVSNRAIRIPFFHSSTSNL